jgi:hypothetical protein
LERIAPLYPLQDLRWSITHISTGTHATFARMKALGLAYNVQLNLYFEAPQLSEWIGADRARMSPPTRVAFDAGLRVAGGTDATRAAPPNTMLALQFQIDGRAVGGSVERRPDLGIARMQALRMYTLNSAWLAGDDDKRGSLEVGKLADLAVLDRDFLDVPVEEIGRTWMGSSSMPKGRSRLSFRSDLSRASQIAKGVRLIRDTDCRWWRSGSRSAVRPCSPPCLHGSSVSTSRAFLCSSDVVEARHAAEPVEYGVGTATARSRICSGPRFAPALFLASTVPRTCKAQSGIKRSGCYMPEQAPL